MAYFDLQLTESGDLQTRMENCLSSFKLSFTVSEFSSQRVSFMAEPSSFPKKINGQRITFNYIDAGNYKLQNESVDGIEEQDRERIIRYIFDEERKKISKEKGLN